MRKRPVLHNGGYYHIFNRGVDKRNIFMSDKDRFRFIHDIFEFNDADAVLNLDFFFRNYGGRTPIVERRPRKLLVDIVAYVLMPNHYHFLVRQRREKGISLFIQKLGGGYTGYFNTKYKRSGVLFQGKHKIKEVSEDRYLRYLVMYIHLNPVDLFSPKWKTYGVQNAKTILKHLNAYRWSSYLDHLGGQNFPSLLNPNLIRDLGLPFGKTKQELVESWLRDYEKQKNNLAELVFDH